MKNTKQLDAEQLLALGRLPYVNLASNAATKALRGDLEPGVYTGEATVRFAYNMTVGEDHESLVSPKVPWKAIAGALFGKLNAATRDKLVRELLESVEGGGFKVKEGAVNEDAEAAIAALLGKTKQTVSGKITGTAVILDQD